nr:PREDICTED: olfactory receptor 4P4-like [Equus przewalskii]
MHYFLINLSLIDICYTSIVTPKLIANLLVERKTISYGNCMLQVFTMHFFGGTEIFILTAMAFDHNVAICKPLHYVIIMNRHITVFVLFWGPVMFIYLIALVYTIIAPIFNPLIYI